MCGVSLKANLQLTGSKRKSLELGWKWVGNHLNDHLGTDVGGMASWLLPKLDYPSLQAQPQPPEPQQRAQLSSPSQLQSPNEGTPLRRQQLQQLLRELHQLQPE